MLIKDKLKNFHFEDISFIFKNDIVSYKKKDVPENILNMKYLLLEVFDKKVIVWVA